MSALNKIKILLGITDNKDDALLEVLVDDCRAMLISYLGQVEVPMQLEFIITELAIKRYRKIGSEGLKSEQIDVISNTFEDDPLQTYYTTIDTYKRNNKKLRML